MAELLAILCVLFFVATVVTLVGHGMWVVLAIMFRSLFGGDPAHDKRLCASCGRMTSIDTRTCDWCGVIHDDRARTATQDYNAFLRELKQEDLGLSVNISSLTGRADELAREAGIVRHSVEYSLGFFGPMDKLPDRPTLQIATMCGHGMVSFNFTRKMMDWVKEGRRTPEQASHYMARF